MTCITIPRRLERHCSVTLGYLSGTVTFPRRLEHHCCMSLGSLRYGTVTFRFTTLIRVNPGLHLARLNVTLQHPVRAPTIWTHFSTFQQIRIPYRQCPSFSTTPQLLFSWVNSTVFSFTDTPFI